MKILTLTKTRNYKLEPYGKFSFKWSTPRGGLKPNQILISELDIKHDTGMPLTKEQEETLVKEMLKFKTNVLTDGDKFYTRVGDDLTEIYHVRLYNYKTDETYRSIVDEMYKLFN
jgi:hypothetical protein